MSRADETRVPPHDEEAEQAVIGSIILEPKAILAALPLLEPRHFYRADHQKIYAACTFLHQKKVQIDVLTMKKTLRDFGSPEIAANADMFTTLCGQVPSVSNCGHYAKIVRDLAIHRETISVCSEMLVKACDAAVEPDELLREAQGKLLSLSRGSLHKDPVTMKALVDRITEQILNPQKLEPAISTGFEGLDQIFGGGVRPGELTVIGGRPSSGKSTAAKNMFAHWSIAGRGVMMFSLEDQEDIVARNVIGTTGRMSSLPLRDGKLTPEDMVKFREAASKLYVENAVVHDSTSLTPAKMQNLIQWQSMKRKVEIVIVDYLQLMESDRRHKERVQDVTDISRSLKIIAREEKCSVIALSQLSRAADDVRPRLSHLRESGAIEQDADAVILLWRKSKEDSDDEYTPTDWLIEKQRNGPTCSVQMMFHKKTLTFLPVSAYRREQQPTQAVQAGQQEDLFEP